jgi:cytochrome P450
MPRRRHPLVGDLPAYARDPIALLERAAAEPGDVAELLVGRRTLLLKRTEDVGHVLAANHRNYEKTPRLTGPHGRRVVGDGLFSAANAGALAQRRPVQPLFGRRALAIVEERIAACADRVLGALPLGAPVDLEPHAERLAASVAATVIFGPDVTPASEGGLAIRRAGHHRAMRSPVQLPGRLPLAVLPSRRRALRALDVAIAEQIRARRAAPGPDLISGLVEAGLGDGEVRAEALSLSIAGISAVTQATASALRELARHPEVAERVREEVAGGGVDAGDTGEAVDARARLPYTEQVVMEAMRLHAPTPMIVRIAQRADRLPSGAAVRRGAKLIVSPHILHRDPALFPDPEHFRPERFTLDARRARTRWAYLPFGAGPRACVGRNLAMLEIVITVARALARFELEPAGDGSAIRLRAAAAAPVAATGRAYTRTP